MAKTKYSEILNKVSKGHVYTHGGGFHADDVCATALIYMLCIKEHIEIPEVHRISSCAEVVEKYNQGYLVYDIGGGEYDHHQSDNEIRDNGIPYAAFGKLFRELGGNLFDRQADIFEKHFVEIIDKCDNSAEDNPFSALIRSMNPTFVEQQQEGISINSQFEKAVNITLAGFGLRQMMIDEGDYRLTELIDDEYDIQQERDVEALRAEAAAKDLVVDAINNKIVVDNKAALISLLPGISYQIIKEMVMEYNISADIPILYYTFAARGAITMKPLADILPPESWRGAKTFDIPGLTFCHNAGISMAVDNMETAKAVLSAIIKGGE